jgi:hypothetical protein
VSVRRTLYAIVSAAGAVLAIAQIAGWKTLGPVDVDSALKAYALVSSPTGFLALANARPREGSDDYGGGRDDDDDFDDRYGDDYDEVHRDFGAYDPEASESTADDQESAFT